MSPSSPAQRSGLFRIGYIGANRSPGDNLENDLLCRIIKKVSGRDIGVVERAKDADLILIYPYITANKIFLIKWIFAVLVKKIFNLKDCATLFRWMVGVKKTPILFVCHENLDRPYWWKMFGNFLVKADIPRLTFWPRHIDPRGCRFPYWYNYVDWQNYPRDSIYSRFGRLYKISELMAPLNSDGIRKSAAVLISSHLDHPRKALVAAVERDVKVEVYGAAGAIFSGPKLGIMKKYRYAFCAENSVGYGYDTEKIPEAWVAGCIPLAVYLNPFSDFNPAALRTSKCDLSAPSNEALLEKEPSLDGVEAYVKKEFF